MDVAAVSLGLGGLDGAKFTSAGHHEVAGKFSGAAIEGVAAAGRTAHHALEQSSVCARWRERRAYRVGGRRIFAAVLDGAVFENYRATKR